MEYISFCTLISSIIKCCIGANHVKVSHGKTIKGETKVNQSTLKAFCICILEIVSLLIQIIWLRLVVINAASVISWDVPNYHSGPLSTKLLMQLFIKLEPSNEGLNVLHHGFSFWSCLFL